MLGRSVVHADCCHDVTCGKFRCPACRRMVGYCLGCCLSDGLDHLCDDCWMIADEARAAKKGEVTRGGE